MTEWRLALFAASCAMVLVSLHQIGRALEHIAADTKRAADKLHSIEVEISHIRNGGSRF